MFVKGPSQRTYWIEDVRTGTEAREALATREPLPEVKYLLCKGCCCNSELPTNG